MPKAVAQSNRNNTVISYYHTMKQILTRDEVAKAITDLAGKTGKKPTLAAIHAALGGKGSMTTLIRLKNEVEAAAQSPVDSEDGLKTFREVWALAVQEGRQQQEAVVAEMRDNLQTVLIENERLEGVASNAMERADRGAEARARTEAALGAVKAEYERRLGAANAALLTANEQARHALDQLATERAERATEVTALRAELVKAAVRSHDLELQLVRAQALLERNAEGGESVPALENRTEHPGAKTPPLPTSDHKGRPR